jgi:hypothetical protein
MSIQHVDPAKVEAVLRYLAQNFSNHIMATFPDPENPHHQSYHISWKGDGRLAHTFVVCREFFNQTDVHHIATKLKAYNLAYALHSTNSKPIVVTAHGIQR